MVRCHVISAQSQAVQTSRCCQLKERERIRLLSAPSKLPFWPGAGSRRHLRLRLERGKAGASLHCTPAPRWRHLPPNLPACPRAGGFGAFTGLFCLEQMASRRPAAVSSCVARDGSRHPTSAGVSGVSFARVRGKRRQLQLGHPRLCAELLNLSGGIRVGNAAPRARAQASVSSGCSDDAICFKGGVARLHVIALCSGAGQGFARRECNKVIVSPK